MTKNEYNMRIEELNSEIRSLKHLILLRQNQLREIEIQRARQEGDQYGY